VVLGWQNSLTTLRSDCHDIKTFLCRIVKVSDGSGQIVTVSKREWNNDQRVTWEVGGFVIGQGGGGKTFFCLVVCVVAGRVYTVFII
jgi:hypothetical protein